MWKVFMKHEKHSQNIYAHQLKYLNEWNLKQRKTFKHLNLTFQCTNFIKFLQVLWNFQKLLATHKNFVKLFEASTNFIKVVCKSHKLRKVVGEFYKLRKVVGKLYEFCKVVCNFYKLCKRLVSPKVLFTSYLTGWFF